MVKFNFLNFKNVFLKVFYLAFFLFLLNAVFVACDNKDIAKEELNKIEIDYSFRRFDKELFEQFEKSQLATVSKEPKSLDYFIENYGEFFKLFVRNIIQIGRAEDPSLDYSLSLFVNDKSVLEIYNKVNEVYTDIDKISIELETAFKRYKYYFPDANIPKVITIISGFNYGVVATDDYLALSLDMFLGEDCEFYDMLGIPKYKSLQMNKENLLPNAVRGWVSTETEFDETDKKLIELMVFEGKMLYVLDKLLPQTSEELKIGFTKEELNWCEKNAANVWAHFIEEELLFSAVYKKTSKYMNEGPFTAGFARESPGKIGHWVGWQIVKKYMDKHPDTSMTALLEIPAEEVLKQSKYKPRYF